MPRQKVRRTCQPWSNTFSPILHRFFETEAIAILTTLVSQYKIGIKEEPQFAHETFEERKARILSCRFTLTLKYVTIYFADDTKPNPTAPSVFPWYSPAENDFLDVHTVRLNRLP